MKRANRKANTEEGTSEREARDAPRKNEPPREGNKASLEERERGEKARKRRGNKTESANERRRRSRDRESEANAKRREAERATYCARVCKVRRVEAPQGRGSKGSTRISPDGEMNVYGIWVVLGGVCVSGDGIWRASDIRRPVWMVASARGGPPGVNYMQ